MTTSKVVFDPFSEEFFNGPWETYRRMQAEAPVYYSEQYDFYALTRHADVAAGLKNFERYSSAYGIDLSMVRSGQKPPQSIIFMDPPDHRHMRSLLNKVFTPRAIQAQRQTVIDKIDKYLGALDPEGFDAVQEFSGPFPVEVITTMLGVPERHAQQVRHWIDESLTREPGQVEVGEQGMQANINTAMLYYDLVKQRRDDPRDDLFTKLINAEIEREDGQVTNLDDLEIAGFATLLGGAGAETVTKLVGNAAVVFARNPEQWQKLLDDRSKVPAAVEELLRYEAPSQYQVRRAMEDVELHGVTIPAGKPVFLINGAANRDPHAWTDPDKFDIDRDPHEATNLGFGYGIHSCLGAALARMESAIALEKLLDFMPAFEVDWAGCKRVHMQNVAGWQSVPVRVLR
ncbi:cytochrome P450 [Mycobacterium marinum]|uniref:Cytochrome P450 190A3 Cyp190A3 n=2 Tax=Mycobacterium marinum TaxID=1781 RepID=B2HG25_MYCMM|nr:cytochrome P450 [Mycobacterium marinum]ACC43137.1 cytochrome P450 190A3 Cyp190A3 [Mycobacterium marinum M]AXN52086.1 Biotin biosynthesis cytochrome P450 [Mycobacterium marinum]EPQ73908.1 putative cytochrome P450 hydroxylase [Mycobacterium marinum str. Europe]MDC8973634.1 cytochrome P450 [Mycobacterium marinum]MDC8983763.1 cytochrome P450 [Mycobacterium marinum]